MGLTRELDVRLIDCDEATGVCADRLHVIQREEIAGGIVGRTDDDDLRATGDRADDLAWPHGEVRG